jgi:uncharacterized protein (DUF433 family)
MEDQKRWSLTPLIRTFVVILVVGAVGLGVMAFTTGNTANRVLITQDDDEDPDRPLFGKGGFRGFGHHGWFGHDADIDYDAFLADALGISVQELQDAYDEADEAVLEDAIAKGYITQEQVDLINAQRALMQYIDQDEVYADALGISVEDLQDAHEADKSLSDLLDELGLDSEDVRDAVQAAYEKAVQDAVDAGVISQDQADDILSSGSGGPMLGGFRGLGDFDGRGGFFGHGRSSFPYDPDKDANQDTGL